MQATTSLLSAPGPAHCFALRTSRRENERGQALCCTALSAQAAQDLANALPFLACGEESAVHAFGGSLLRHVDASERAAMARIAADELRHAAWLERLRQGLPAPDLVLPTDRMTRFFRSLLTRQPALHFARVAALDRTVCKLLAPLLHAKAALAAVPEVRKGLVSIARDEARHVQVACGFALRLGLSKTAQADVNARIETQLRVLLAPIKPGLERLASHRTAAAPA